MFNEETNKQEKIELNYNNKTEMYEGLFKIESDSPSGHWFLYDIEAYDMADNYGLEIFFIRDKQWVL